ncbi:hypothetical protein CTAYLR_002274 [Chrysophaeum taylorii]|uniref:Tudor domain-containing protein n=1 Tax=Chrysophaeum taylorii TaxID=2483200 RepID=A0AAD7XU58_9STRA|nr:hypothetical protein CTAYLR_002274 [Chrysophaeum taylorii]
MNAMEPILRQYEVDENVEVGASVLVKSPECNVGWYAGTVVGAAKVSGRETYRVVFVDGNALDGIEKHKLRAWNKPPELPWHERRKLKRGARDMARERDATISRAVGCDDARDSLQMANRQARMRGIILDTEPGRQYIEPQIIACCRGMTPQAGGYGWRFAEARTKIDMADVDELLSVNATVMIQQANPKRPGTKSHALYEKYKKATTLREMLTLGGRRPDISWVIFLIAFETFLFVVMILRMAGSRLRIPNSRAGFVLSQRNQNQETMHEGTQDKIRASISRLEVA